MHTKCNFLMDYMVYTTLTQTQKYSMGLLRIIVIAREYFFATDGDLDIAEEIMR